MHGLGQLAQRIPRGTPRRVVRVHRPDDERRARIASHRGESRGFGRCHRERLLTQDAAHSGRDRGLHLLGMKRGRAADCHHIDGRVGEQCFDRRGPRCIHSSSHRARDAGVDVHHVRDPILVWEPGQRRDVDGLRHGSRTDDPDAEGTHALAPAEMKHGILTA